MSHSPEALEQSLHRLSLAALLVGMESRAAVETGRPISDTVYDRFLWDYVGDLITGEAAKTCQIAVNGQEYHYDEPLSLSFSEEGTLAAIRRATAVHSNDLRRYLVATADLVNGKTTEWHVTDVHYTGRGDNLRTDLWLSEQPLHAVPAQVEEETNDILLRALHSKTIALANTQAKQRMPHFVLQGRNGGNNFTGMHGLTQQLAPIEMLIGQVNDLRNTLIPEMYQHRETTDSQTLGNNVVALSQRRHAI